MRTILLLLALAASPAWAEWVSNGTSDNGGTAFYYDPATIRINGNMRRIWQGQDLRKIGKKGELSRRTLTEYDCKEERFRLLSVSVFSGSMFTGDTLSSNSNVDQWDYVPPESNAAEMLEIVCARK